MLNEFQRSICIHKNNISKEMYQDWIRHLQHDCLRLLRDCHTKVGYQVCSNLLAKKKKKGIITNYLLEVRPEFTLPTYSLKNVTLPT